MSTPGPQRAPGWYPDPDDPIRMRHWSGRSWSGRRRPLPAWSVAFREVTPDGSPVGGEGVDGPVLDGPVRAEALPAIASASVHTGEIAERRAHPARSGTGARSTRRAAPAGPATPNLMPPSGLDRRRFVLLIVGCVAVLALLIAVVNAGNGGPQAYSAVSIDRSYLTAANRACSAALGASRTVPSISAPSTNAGDAAKISTAATSVATLEAKLKALPATPAAAPQISRWLSDWSAYVHDERDDAADLTSPEVAGAARPRVALDRADAVSAATGADSFALRNGLGSCTIGAGATPIESIP
jgi:hypothetical protein